MARHWILLIVAIVIANASLIPAARCNGMRLPSCLRLQQMNSDISKLALGLPITLATATI
jgi:hypothetical protein